MVGLWGMSHVIGPVTVISEEAQMPFPGASDVSPQTQQLVDDEVRHLIEDAHEQVTQLMSANRERLDSLAGTLCSSTRRSSRTRPTLRRALRCQAGRRSPPSRAAE